MTQQLWIEPIGGIIVARVRGVPTEEILREAHERIAKLVKETGFRSVLYDGLELEAPPIEVPISQWKLDKAMEPLNQRRAIVVPNTRLAYLARLAFDEESSRVFYNDLTAAIRWLESKEN